MNKKKILSLTMFYLFIFNFKINSLNASTVKSLISPELKRQIDIKLIDKLIWMNEKGFTINSKELLDLKIKNLYWLREFYNNCLNNTADLCSLLSIALKDFPKSISTLKYALKLKDYGNHLKYDATNTKIIGITSGVIVSSYISYKINKYLFDKFTTWYVGCDGSCHKKTPALQTCLDLKDHELDDL